MGPQGYGITDVVWDKDPLGSGCMESCGMGTPVRDGQRRRKRPPWPHFTFGFGAQGPVPETKRERNRALLTRKLRKKRTEKEIRKVVKEKNDRHSVSEMEASVPMRRPKSVSRGVSGGAA